MRHLKSGSKLGKQPAHRRAVLRNLVTNLIEKERIHTTILRAKATRRLAEKMITLGKRDSLHARLQEPRKSCSATWLHDLRTVPAATRALSGRAGDWETERIWRFWSSSARN